MELCCNEPTTRHTSMLPFFSYDHNFSKEEKHEAKRRDDLFWPFPSTPMLSPYLWLTSCIFEGVYVYR